MREVVPELHPLNRAFDWQLRREPFRRVTPEQAAQYDLRGYFLLEGAVPVDQLAELIAAIDPIEAAVEELVRASDGGRMFIARADEITFTTHLVAVSEVVRRFVDGEVFRDLVHDLIGPDVRLYWDQAVYKKPGTEDPFPWHQDNGYTFVEPQQYLTCWVALTDATIDNGCPWVVPGLHRLGTLEHRLTDLGFVCLDHVEGAIPVEARAGDVVVLSSLTPHCTGPNRTDEVRKSYIVQFAPEGATVVGVDREGREQRFAADAADRQFPVLVAGEVPPRGSSSSTS